MTLPTMTRMTRRRFAALAALLLPAARMGTARAAAASDAIPPTLGEATPFDDETVPALARDLAARDYAAPRRVPDAWANLS